MKILIISNDRGKFRISFHKQIKIEKLLFEIIQITPIKLLLKIEKIGNNCLEFSTVTCVIGGTQTCG